MEIVVAQPEGGPQAPGRLPLFFNANLNAARRRDPGSLESSNRSQQLPPARAVSWSNELIRATRTGRKRTSSGTGPMQVLLVPLLWKGRPPSWVDLHHRSGGA